MSTKRMYTSMVITTTSKDLNNNKIKETILLIPQSVKNKITMKLVKSRSTNKIDILQTLRYTMERIITIATLSITLTRIKMTLIRFKSITKYVKNIKSRENDTTKEVPRETNDTETGRIVLKTTEMKCSSNLIPKLVQSEQYRTPPYQTL